MRIYPTGIVQLIGGSEVLYQLTFTLLYQRLNVLIRENEKGLPFIDDNAKAAFRLNYFRSLSRGLTKI